MLALVGLASVVLPLNAQNLLTVADEIPNSIVLVSVDEAGDELIEVMNASQLPHVHDPQAPRFVCLPISIFISLCKISRILLNALICNSLCLHPVFSVV